MRTTPAVSHRSPLRRSLLALAATLTLVVAACGNDDGSSDASGAADAPTSVVSSGGEWTVQVQAEDEEPPAFLVLERDGDEVRLPRLLVEHVSSDSDRTDCAARGMLRRNAARDDEVDVDLDSLTIEAYSCFTAEALEAQLVAELEADGVDSERIGCVTEALGSASPEEWATALVWDAEGIVFEPCGIDR